METIVAAGSTTEVVKKRVVQNVTVTSTAKKLAAPIKFQNAITWQLENNSVVLKSHCHAYSIARIRG